MAGTFTIPEFNSSYTITDSNLVRIGDKKFLEKKMGSLAGTFTIPSAHQTSRIGPKPIK
jgi:hypothetical protein